MNIRSQVYSYKNNISRSSKIKAKDLDFSTPFLKSLFEQDVMLFVLCSSYMPGLGFVPKSFFYLKKLKYFVSFLEV